MPLGMATHLAIASTVALQVTLHVLATTTTLPIIIAATNATTTFNDVNLTTPATSASNIEDATDSFYIASVKTTQSKPKAAEVPEIVLTLVIIAGCALLGIGIAKLGDWLYDRRMATKDDISNASSYTKNILRSRVAGVKKALKTRLAVMKMKKEPKNKEDQVVRQAAAAWVETAGQLPHNKEQETRVDVDNTNNIAQSNTPAITVQISKEDDSQSSTILPPIRIARTQTVVAPADLKPPPEPVSTPSLSPSSHRPRSPLF